MTPLFAYTTAADGKTEIRALLDSKLTICALLRGERIDVPNPNAVTLELLERETADPRTGQPARKYRLVCDGVDVFLYPPGPISLARDYAHPRLLGDKFVHASGWTVHLQDGAIDVFIDDGKAVRG